jgi:hypothetical protein
MKPDDSYYRGVDPFTREQAIFVVECILIGTLDRVESGLPHTISYEDRRRDDPRDTTGLTSYERGGLEAAGMSLGVFFAQLTYEGLDIYDALTCARVDDVSFDVAIEHLVRGAWADCKRIQAASRRPRSLAELYGDLWPDTRKYAEAFVAKTFSDYDFAPDVQGAGQRAGKPVTQLFPVDVTDRTVVRYWIEADSAEAAKEIVETAGSKAALDENAVDHENLVGRWDVELPENIGPRSAMSTFYAFEVATSGSYTIHVDLSAIAVDQHRTYVTKKAGVHLDTYAVGTVAAVNAEEALESVRQGKWAYSSNVAENKHARAPQVERHAAVSRPSR